MLCPFARNRTAGVPNKTPGGMREHRGLVLHIQQGTEAGTDSWFHNPNAQVSAHFGVAKDGTLDQWVDTNDRAWAEMAGNPSWLSVECEGRSGDDLTWPQVATLGKLFEWLERQYGFGLQSTNNPGGKGLGYHAMGGQAWGGHLQCPGAPIIAARPQIIARAQQIRGTVNGPTSNAFPLKRFTYFGNKPRHRIISVRVHDGHGSLADRMAVKRIQAGLNKRYPASDIPEDGIFGSRTDVAVRRLQGEKRLTKSGLVGPAEWRLLTS